MSAVKKFFASRTGVISVGAFIGVLAALLQKWGNPGNMGICVACFKRDIAGAIGLHRAEVVQYLRPEILGLVLGAFISAYMFKEYHARAGSAPIVRFILGMIAMIGALVFLGCPWRAMLRLAGGDGNAIFGVLGLAGGIGIGALFFKSGYNLGRNQRTYPAVGWLLPLIIFGLLVLRFMYPQIPGQDKSGVLFYSLKGPGAMYAPLGISLVAGLAIGMAAQRSRFCTMGAFRDLFLFRQMHLLSGIIALLMAAFLTNLLLGQFNPGFTGQPVAHTMELWNFLGMVVAGLAFALAGGCPGRQLFMAGEGDGDAAVFALGMIIGATVSHNFGLASSPKGIGPYAIPAVIISLIVLFFIGFTMRQKA
jgi:YedE family putative selenium metabolism protein